MLIIRNPSTSDRTAGTLILPDGSEFKTLERPWLNNRVNVSCIPTGRYIFKRDTHGKHQWFRLLNVEGRTDIEFHTGTKPSHSNGCILVSYECLNAMLWFYSDSNLNYVLEIR